MLIVAQREFLERVRSKAFVLGTMIFPLFLAGIWLVPALMGGGGGTVRLAIVDEAPPHVADAVVRQLLTPPPAGAERDAIAFLPYVVPGPFAAVRDSLTARVRDGTLDGFLVLPPDVVESSRALYRAENVTDFDVLKAVESAVTDAVRAVRLERAGLQQSEVAALIRPVTLDAARITAATATGAADSGASAKGTFVFAYVTMFLMYLLLLSYGVQVLQSVIDEKTNRISEVIVSSMKATHLMAGKIAGIAAVAMVQVVVWVALAALALTQSGYIQRQLDLDAGTLEAFRVEPLTGAALLGFFVLGFLLYAALYAALGAAVTSMQEAQQVTFVLILPLIVPMAMIPRIAADPLGPFATALGLIPLTAPVTMPMRLGTAALPAWQTALSLALLAAAVVLVGWLAGKIYRVGILSTGQKASLREVGRWIRAA
jgi:ABC-2 type transport system permease protein